MEKSLDSDLLDSSNEDKLNVVESESSENSIEDLLGTESNYRLLELLGEGGMGQVYKAQDKRTGNYVALKILQSKFADDASALKRFQLEAKAAQSLKHENLNEVFDFDTTDDGTAFIVMNYIEGESLRTIIADDQFKSKYSDKDLLDMFIKIADGLGFAHDNGVVHRDVKPSNVMISEGQAKLLDFGIAISDKSSVRETQDLTRTGEVFGSPQYMSPEQCLGFKLDARSDIYSLGCLMYELVSGKPPFDGENPMQLVVSHINENPPPFKKEFKKNAYTRRLERVILHCLEKDQADRYQNANALKKDLELISENKEIPKYESKYRYKASISLRGAFTVAAGICLLVPVLSVFQPDRLPYWTGQIVFGTAFIALCSIGAYTFFAMTMELVKECKSIGFTMKSWFQIFTTGCLAITGYSLAPYVMCSYFLTTYRHQSNVSFIPTEWINFAMFLTIISAGVAITLSIFAGIGWIIFRKSKSKATIEKPLALLLIVSVSIIPLFFQFAPNKVADFSNRLAYLIEGVSPSTAVSLHNLTLKMDQSRYWYYTPYSIMKLYEKNNQLDKAIAFATKTLENSENKQQYGGLLSRRAELYRQNGQLDKAKADWQETLKYRGFKQSDSYVGIAEIEAEQNNFDAAMKVLNESITAYPAYHNKAYDTKIGVLCRFGKYEQALEELAKLEEVSQDTHHWKTIEGVIYKNLGKKEKAQASFQIALSDYQKLVDDQNNAMVGMGYLNQNDHLAAAYTANQLSKLKLSEELIKKANKNAWLKLKKSDISAALNLKVSKLEISWND